jgi:hypothetical protein
MVNRAERLVASVDFPAPGNPSITIRDAPDKRIRSAISAIDRPLEAFVSNTSE